MRVKVVGNLQCQLGEGLYWDMSRQSLWGVDIQGCRVWRWKLDDPKVDLWNVGQRVGWVIPLQGHPDQVLLGLQQGVVIADAESLVLQKWIQKPFDRTPFMRLNDAKADVTGAVWCGSLNNDDESQPVGSLYRLSAGGRWEEIDTGYTVANGPAIDASQKVLMHTDSVRRAIYRFDLNVFDGTLSNKRIWKALADSEGYPDGMCFDAEGNLWIAHWGGACVSRFSLDGRLLARVEIPTSHVTNVCFGGPELDRLFVSTARVGLTADQLTHQPYAGSLFEVIGHGTKGLPSLPASADLVKAQDD